MRTSQALRMYEEVDVRVILLSSTINIAALVWNEAGISLSLSFIHTHRRKSSSLHFSSFRPRRRRGRHFNCSGEEMASFHLDGHIMNIFHFELSFTYRVSQLFSL